MTKNRLIILIISLSVCLFGCGKTTDEEKALADFSEKISDFTEYIKETDEKINNLDPADKASIDSLLQILDDMDDAFQAFSEIDAPTQYQDIENLAQEASENMSLAVSYYHAFFENEPFSEQDADTAYDYYKRAMKRVRYIGYMLTGGEIPEDENVTIYEEANDGNILHKLISDDKEENNTASTETFEAVD